MGRGRRDCDVIFFVCLHAKKDGKLRQASKRKEEGEEGVGGGGHLIMLR